MYTNLSKYRMKENLGCEGNKSETDLLEKVQTTVGQINQKQVQVLGHLLVHLLVCSLAHSLAQFAHSLACGKLNDWMAIFSVFFLYSGP